jgi:uncharacterized protein YdeI (YjbR/CyaY-like superfamily)
VTVVPKIRPRDRAAWRAWLAEHHATATEVIVEFARKGARKPTVTYPEAVEEALCFGWIDGTRRTVDASHYSNRFSPRRPGSAWAPSNKQRVAELEAAGLLQPAGIAVIEAAKADGSWTKPTSADTSKEMPAELTAAFKKSTAAKKAYAALAPGQQRMWNVWVATAKQAETRVRRAAKAIDLLVAGAKLPV